MANETRWQQMLSVRSKTLQRDTQAQNIATECNMSKDALRSYDVTNKTKIQSVECGQSNQCILPDPLPWSEHVDCSSMSILKLLKLL